jgi:amino acid adenylation domain-containing protein
VGAGNHPAQGEHGTLDATAGAFWRAIVGAPGDALSLPARRARPATLPSEFASIKAPFGPALAARFDALAGAWSVPAPVAILAALEAFLCRYAAQREIGIGIGAALATEFGHEHARVDVLPLRAALAPASDIRAAIAETVEDVARAAGHAAPLRDIVASSGAYTSASHAAAVQVIVDLDSGDAGPLAKTVADATGSAPDLILGIADATAGGLRATYNTALFDAIDAERLLAHFRVFVDGVAAAPETPLGRVPMLDADERRVLLAEAGEGRTFDASRTLHAWFERQVKRTPDAPALTFEGRTLTYAQLNERANRLAHYLRKRGARPDRLVGLCLTRSLELVVGVLGILKSGAAYLPLDLSYPKERVAGILADAEAPLLLTLARDVPELPDHAAEIIRLDADWNAIAAESAADPAPLAVPKNLAYVIYTSGSTGKPKGCEITHANVVRLFTATEHWFGFSPADVWTLFHSHAFDFSVWEIWGALLYGGRLVVVPLETARSPAAFLRLLSAEQVTFLNQTPSAFRALIEADLKSGAPLPLALRSIVFGGEALELQMLRPWIERRGDSEPELVNMYGITETTVHVTYRRILSADVEAGAGSVIGRPIPDLRVLLLDPEGELVPRGVTGEMYVGGAGVARGYLRRPELTAERFVEWPAKGASARLYRTGDLARRLDDGSLEYLGRIDHQVKIRGFRIETGEIEATLMREPGVRACAVIAQDDGSGEKRLVAYVVGDEPRVDVARFRAARGKTLPEYMVPAVFMPLDALPITGNGKLDRTALPKPGRLRPDIGTPFAPPADTVEARVCQAFAELLELDLIGRDDNFFALGGNSLKAVRVVAALGGDLTVPAFFRNPTPAAIASVLRGEASTAIAKERFSRRTGSGSEPVAIIAMAGRFPGASDVEMFWQNLCDGKETITFFAPDEIDPGVPRAERDDPAYVRARGIIDGVEDFDPAFFGVTPREAELTDPQQRLFLELCWEALERGGYAADAQQGPVGVFGGVYGTSYLQRNIAAHPDRVRQLGDFQVMLGNDKDFVATRVAFRLNLTGPALSVHTACSTSLVAVCQAVAALRANQCDMALAGGAAVTCPPRTGYLYQDGAMLAPDGHTRTFDAEAQGTVFSDGAAVVLLKRLGDALADGDPVYAVIRGAGLSNDGAIKASFTAPSSEGQATAIAMAIDDAEVDARSISYVEAHGTATPLGDPVELEGLTQAFRRTTADTGFCRIGSVKSNIGHVVAAAGAAGLIKTALALAHRTLPPTLHFKSPNPKIDFARSPFVPNAALTPWTADGPLRAGVSSFGVGGTNAHVIVEEAPAREASDPAEGPQLLVLSARSPDALRASAKRLADHLAAVTESNLADVAYTLAVGRKAFAHRASVVAADAHAAIAALRELRVPEREARASEVVFMFPGQGAYYEGMGRALYESEPVFRDALDACAAIALDELGLRLTDVMFAGDADAMNATELQQPATFALEYALARLWIALGVHPAAMIGHSVGEFVAATIGGVWSLEDGLKLVIRRARLMQAQPSGAMLSVRIDAAAMEKRLPAGLSLAADNAPNASVVSGPHEDIEKLRAALDAEGIAAKTLRTSHAFHSSMMDAVLAPFREEVARIALQPSAVPISSTRTGAMLGDAEVVSPEYWTRHLRDTVRFSPALRTLLKSHDVPLLEIGPRAVLSTLARQHEEARGRIVIPSLADAPERERAAWLGAAGQLWSAGVAVTIADLDRRARRHRVRLPTYPFERRRCWVDAAPAPDASAPAVVAAALTAIAETRPEPVPLENPMPQTAAAPADRKPRLIGELKALFEDVAGLDLADADAGANFMEFGLDSLALTQVALQLQKSYPVKITFRELMESLSTFEQLAMHIEKHLPADAPAPAGTPAPAAAMPPLAPMAVGGGGLVQQVIQQQMQIMQQQLALLAGGGVAPPAAQPAAAPVAATAAPAAAAPAHADEEAALTHSTYDVKKAFGAIARIHSGRIELTEKQRMRLDAFVRRYIARTPKSKAYTVEHRPHLADPRVVNGFRPLIKEIVYQIVVDRSKGARLWDIDGNEYVDVASGFGMDLFGWQPDFVLEAVKKQLELGYEIGPQHPLAGEVAKLVCELTGFDRAGLCNTGSEAVMGTVRIARTVTGRNTLVIFTGSYHGIFDEVLVRGTKKLRAVPAAPGILRNVAENVLVLDYGTPESLAIIRERANDIAAVLVEPVQSRRPDFQPVEFLRELREITRASGSLLIFDEVVTGFRAHPRGAQALLGIDADIASYGKVVGGGFPIGIIAGKRQYMDALDGGAWNYGDDSVPTVGVTYFAGTFVRHPLALAAAKAVLEHLKSAGPALQERLNARTAAFADEVNAYCASVGAPIAVKQFSSFWKVNFAEDHPMQELLFAMMRSRGVHLLDNFPCFFTTAHAEADFAAVAKAFKESVQELQEAEFIPQRKSAENLLLDANKPPVPGAKLGKDRDGRPAWFVPNPDAPGKFVKVGT